MTLAINLFYVHDIVIFSLKYSDNQELYKSLEFNLLKFHCRKVCENVQFKENFSYFANDKAEEAHSYSENVDGEYTNIRSLNIRLTEPSYFLLQYRLTYFQRKYINFYDFSGILKY